MQSFSLFGSWKNVIFDPITQRASFGPATSMEDVILPRDFKSGLPNVIPLTEYLEFTEYLRETGTSEEDFAQQLIEYPMLDYVSILDNIGYSLLDLSKLNPTPLNTTAPFHRYREIALPRELKFFVLTRGYLPYMEEKALRVAVETPNLYSAWKLFPKEVESYPNRNLIPEPIAVEFFGQPNLEFPPVVHIPFSRDIFPTFSSWVRVNNEISVLKKDDY